MIWLKLLDIHVMPPSQHKCSTEKFMFYKKERNHSHPILHTNDVTPKAQSELENFLTPCRFTMEGTFWG